MMQDADLPTLLTGKLQVIAAGTGTPINVVTALGQCIRDMLASFADFGRNPSMGGQDHDDRPPQR